MQNENCSLSLLSSPKHNQKECFGFRSSASPLSGSTPATSCRQSAREQGELSELKTVLDTTLGALVIPKQPEIVDDELFWIPEEDADSLPVTPCPTMVSTGVSPDSVDEDEDPERMMTLTKSLSDFLSFKGYTLYVDQVIYTTSTRARLGLQNSSASMAQAIL
eukprot:Skav226826  [mRNA]  locus=scaffold606:252577:255030:+ [translate_table: standard]